MTDDILTRLLTTREAAKYLGITPNTLAVWRKSNNEKIPHIKMGRHCKYLIEDLENYIKSKRYSK